MRTFYLFTVLVFCITAVSPSSLFSEEVHEYQAHLVPLDEATLSSQYSGRIIRLGVRDGESFKKGDELVGFDCSILEAELTKARLSVETARETYESNKELAQYQSISTLEVNISRRKLEQANAQRRIIRTQLRYCSVKAPYGGKVVRRLVHLYESVEVNTPLLEIVKSGTPEVRFFIPSTLLMQVSPGDTFQVHMLETSRSYAAVVDRLGSRIDPVSQTVEVYGHFPQEHDELLPGMSGRVVFSGLVEEHKEGDGLIPAQ